MKRISCLLRIAARRRLLVFDCGGAITIETALLAMPLFLFLFTIINAGHALWLQNALDLSVTDAARCASIAAASSESSASCKTLDEIKAYAAGRSGAGFDSSIFIPTLENCGYQVTATYPLTLPLVGSPLTLSAQACYPQLSGT